ncbi:MAG: glycosyltransferase family A protein [Cyanobacteria bacterium P01_E01_bin.6]
MDEFSIIIPAYNGDRFLAHAIESVLSQTLQTFEIIVVNDGSTDETAHVLEPYGDRIRYIYQENQGVAAARNRGLELATGEYIVFLDQDDYWKPTKLEEQVAYFKQNSHVGIVHSGWRRVRENGELIVDVTPWDNAPTLDLHEWLLYMPVLLSAMMFHRPWVEQVGFFDTQYIQACDVDWVQRLVFMGCPSVWLRKVTTYYRQHDRNESSNTSLQAHESWQVRDTFFAQPDLPSAVRQRESEYRYHTLVWIAWRLYMSRNLREMHSYLHRALTYSPYPKTQTVINIVRGFEKISREQGYGHDVSDLLNSSEWTQLIQTVMS